eukprot:TRINITY_DN7909_c0_g1_i2.p2 TRINITY_DN7909_c0_g1~~TRINITY_DN7909_c0_g1_i2.p2  ORF type:complete len:205 (-),score=57.30 TRINITY_DN7909_c0_g1_i2:1022-1636(-)
MCMEKLHEDEGNEDVDRENKGTSKDEGMLTNEEQADFAFSLLRTIFDDEKLRRDLFSNKGCVEYLLKCVRCYMKVTEKRLSCKKFQFRVKFEQLEEKKTGRPRKHVRKKLSSTDFDTVEEKQGERLGTVSWVRVPAVCPSDQLLVAALDINSRFLLHLSFVSEKPVNHFDTLLSWVIEHVQPLLKLPQREGTERFSSKELRNLG